MKNILLILGLCLVTLHYCSSQELTPYLKDGLYGFATAAGKVVIEPLYENVTDFGSPFFLKQESEDCYVSRYGHEKPQLKIAHVKLKGKWTAINLKGERIIQTLSTQPYKIKSIGSDCDYYSIYNKECMNALKAVKVVNTTDYIWKIFYLETEKPGLRKYEEDSLGIRGMTSRYEGSHYIAKTLQPDTLYRRVYYSGPIGPKQDSSSIADDKQDNKSDSLYYLAPPLPIYDLLDCTTGEAILSQLSFIKRVCGSKYHYIDLDKNNYIFNTNNLKSRLLPYHVHKFHLRSGTQADIPGLKMPSNNNIKLCEIEYYTIGEPNKVGLINEYGHHIIQEDYNRVHVYDDYIIATKGKGSWFSYSNVSQSFLFSKQGHLIDIPPTRLILSVSHSDLFIAELMSGKFILLDKTGQPISSVEYDKLEVTSHNVLAFSKGHISGILDRDTGQEVISYPCDKMRTRIKFKGSDREYFTFTIDDKEGLISSDKKVIYPAEYSFISKLNYSNDQYVVLDSILENEKSYDGLGDLEGTVLITPQYDDIQLRDKKNIVCFNRTENEKSKWEEVARFDLDINPVDKPDFRKRESNFGVDPMRVSSGTVIVDSEGNRLSDTTYWTTRRYEIGDDYIMTGTIGKEDGEMDIFNSKGQRLSKRGAIMEATRISNGTIAEVLHVEELNAIIVTEGSTQALINLDGEYLVPAGKYSKISYGHEHIALTRKEDDIPYTTLYTKDLQQVTKEYAYVRGIHGLSPYYGYKTANLLVAEVQNKKKRKFKFGIIDAQGKIILPLEYNWGRIAIEGVSLTKTKGKESYSYFYDYKLNLIDEGPYDFYDGKIYRSKKVGAIKGDDYVTIHPDGKTTSKPMIYKVQASDMVVKKKGKEVWLCDHEGNIITKGNMDNGQLFSQGVIRISDDRFIFQEKNLLYLLAKNGQVLEKLPFDIFWSHYNRYGNKTEKGKVVYMYDQMSDSDHQELLEKKLFKFTLEEQLYFYNFETLVKFKD